MLDDHLPAYDFNELHRISISATPGVVMTAARELTLRELPLLTVLMGVRSIPALGRGRRPPAGGRIIDAFARGGFVTLEDTPAELVFGAVGRFWRASGDLKPIEAARFREFDAPGWAKAAFNFRAEAANARTVLYTETRVRGTDEHARRMFRRYWLLIRPGSGVIRVAWLRAIRRRAERG